ncbi:MAG TPA: ATP-binding protein [Acidobacteriaceae bacterium]|jgi:PAS domain S-box-containing protein|nr:ATP-binding protein [Acidobacteriaceae bacterium]
METNLYNRVIATLLAIATVALILFAVFNLQQESKYEQPDDGVVWTEGPSRVLTGLIAVRVTPGGPGAQAGIIPGDLLTAVNDHTIEVGADLDRELKHTDVYGKAEYSIIRGRGRVQVELDPIPVIPIPADRTLQDFTRVIGLIYLAIGIYVLFRRWTAPQATHFYIFCLVSFALNTFRYTGKFDLLDWTIYWGNVIAEVLQPALFLHFALVFAQESARLRHWSRRWLVPFVYAPAAGILALRVCAFLFWQATFSLRLRLDQVSTAYVAAYFILAAILFLRSYAHANTPLLRQQLKWLTRGTMLAVLPFTAFFAVPFLTGLPVPVLLQKIAGLSLVILPLTFSWAIVRYRLMDTDLIFKRGVAYTLATGTLVGVYFAVVALISEQIHTRLPEAVREWGLVLTILITAQLFEPLKRRFQSWIDRVFDRHRYDYRKALVEFGRGLSSETDLQALLQSIVDRLPSTLLVAKVGVFLADSPGEYRLAASHGLPFSDENYTPRLDLGFLDFDQPGGQSHIFLENTQQTLHLSEEQQRTAALLDLNYYLPCRVQDAVPSSTHTASANGAPAAAQTRTIAVIGLGRTIGGDFLSSEDVELLESLASYIGIALQSASLYARLEDQVSEFERLKEFNENIVESINVGILAVDLEDRIESWNAQMEAMYALSRKEAIGQPLTAVFPLEFIEAFDRFRNESGVHHLYKFRLTTMAGEARTANIAVAPLLSRDFVAVGRIVLVDDITERITLEAQLAQSDKLSSIGLLAAGVAHEINTPLAVISSYAQMLTKQMRDDARLTPLLERITQQTFRASEIANGLLNFSRTSTTEFRETDLNQVIRDTLALVEHQMKTARIAVAMDLSTELPRIHGNPGKLQQVFLNLLLNAKDAMPQGGELRVATVANGHVEAVIADSGAGIAPEHLKRIYDPFFTTKSAPKPGERRGTGLGLSVSYGIIQEHAGKINVESTLGVGTTFHLEFPLLRNSVHA